MWERGHGIQQLGSQVCCFHWFTASVSYGTWFSLEINPLWAVATLIHQCSINVSESAGDPRVHPWLHRDAMRCVCTLGDHRHISDSTSPTCMFLWAETRKPHQCGETTQTSYSHQAVLGFRPGGVMLLYYSHYVTHFCAWRLTNINTWHNRNCNRFLIDLSLCHTGWNTPCSSIGLFTWC